MFRPCLLADMSRAKNTIMPHYVNVASGSFFGAGFCSVCGLQLFYFFSVFSKKINVLQVCWLTKTMTKKLTATPNTAPVFWRC